MNHLTAKNAWIGIGVGVLAYELAAPKGELLSEQYDRWLEDERTKAAAVLGTLVVSAHLLNLIPDVVDPFHQSVGALRRYYGK